MTDDQIAEINRASSSSTVPTGLLTEDQIAEINGQPRELPTGLLAEDPIVGLTPAPAPTPEGAAKAVKDSLAQMNEITAQLKADQIAKIAGEEEGTAAMFGIGDNKDKIKEQLEGLPPDLRKNVLAKLEGDDALSGDALRTIDEANHDVDLDEKIAKKKAAAVDSAVKIAEGGGSAKEIEASLDGLSEKRREEALSKMSPDAREVAEKALDKRHERLEKLAEKLEKAQHGTSAADATDEVGILTGLTGLTSSEAEELEEIYGEKFKDGDKARSLKKDLQAEFGKDDKETKFIGAVFNGDREKAAELSVDLAVEYIDNEADDLFVDDDTINVFLRAHAKDKAAADRIVDAYKDKTGKDLSKVCEEEMSEEGNKEAAAYQRADMRSANVAIAEQGNKERNDALIDELADDQQAMKDFANDARTHTGKNADELLGDNVSNDKKQVLEVTVADEDKKRLEAREKVFNEDLAKLGPAELAAAKKKADDTASKLSTELSKVHLVGNNFEVTEALRGLTPAEVKLTLDAFKKQEESRGKEGDDVDLEKKLREKLEGKDLAVADAVLSGDKVQAAVAFFRQGADGAGTNIDGMDKSVANLNKEERIRFKEQIDKQVGGVDGAAVNRMITEESSSFDRDKLKAQMIEDDDERAGALAAVAASRNAYGGKLATTLEGIDDVIADELGINSDRKRADRREGRREHDFMFWYSNAGGGEDAIVDAAASLENDAQRDAFKSHMRAMNKESARETFESELSGGHLDAATGFVSDEKGAFEKAQATRMVAELHNYVNNRENEASLPFENVRLDPARLKEIAALPPEAQKLVLEAEKAGARARLLGEADAAARKAGYDDYCSMLKGKLTEDQYSVAMDRIVAGKPSDVNALLVAGETLVGPTLGKDSAKFYEILQDKTPEEIEKLRQQFKDRGKDLDSFVIEHAGSAGERRDFQIFLEGNYARIEPAKLEKMAADNPAALIKRVKDLDMAARGGADHHDYDPLGNFTRKHGNELGNEIASLYSNTDERLKDRLAAVEEIEGRLAKLGEGEQLSKEDQDALIAHMKYMSGDQKSFTEVKTSASDTVGEGLGTVAELGILAFSGNSELASIANSLVKITVTSNLDAGRYSADKGFSQLTEAVIGAALGRLGGAAGSHFDDLAKAGVKTVGGMPVSLAKELVDLGIGGIGGGLLKPLTTARNYLDGGTMTTAMYNSVVDEVINSVIGKTMAGFKLPQGADYAKLLGGGNKLATNVLTTLVTGDWSKSTFDNALSVLWSTTKGVAKGSAEDHAKQQELERTGPSPNMRRRPVDVPEADEEPMPPTIRGPNARKSEEPEEAMPPTIRGPNARPSEEIEEPLPPTIRGPNARPSEEPEQLPPTIRKTPAPHEGEPPTIDPSRPAPPTIRTGLSVEALIEMFGPSSPSSNQDVSVPAEVLELIEMWGID